MDDITGTWHLRMKTPIDTIAAVYRFTDTGDGLTGTASAAGEEVPLREITREPVAGGQRVTWIQPITKPMRLNLDYDITVTGDRLAGHSRAGRLPGTTVTGERA